MLAALAKPWLSWALHYETALLLTHSLGLYPISVNGPLFTHSVGLYLTN